MTSGGTDGGDPERTSAPGTTLRAPPPGWAERLLRRVLPPADREDVVEQMAMLHAQRVARDGARRADRWYGRHALRFAWTLAAERAWRGGGGDGMTGILTELARATRRLARAPVFTTVSVLTMAVGGAAFAAVFSAVDGVLLEPPPYEEPDELVWVWRDYWFGLHRGWLGGPDIPALRAHTEAFEGVAAFRTGGRNLTGRAGDHPRRVDVTFASAGIFDLLGVRVALGRGFLPGEDAPDAPAVAVLGHDLWHTHFAADPRVVGTEIYLNGEPTKVVGVAPEEFRFVVHTSLGEPAPADLFQPLRLDLAAQDPGWGMLAGLARAQEDATRDQVDAAIAAVAQDLDDQWHNPGLKMWGVGLHEDLVAEVRPALSTLLVAAALLLIILGANLATLLLARATTRDRELAVRAALGAGRRRLFQSVLAESVVLGGAGALLGLLLASPAIRVLRALAPDGLPRRMDIQLDLSVALVTFAVVLLVGMGAGFLPAARALRGAVAERLREGGGRTGGGSAGVRARGGLVVAQVALSLVLLVAAGLLGRGVASLLASDPGFDARSVLTFTVAMDPGRYGQDGAIADLDRRLRSGILRLPGVERVGATNALPLSAAASQRDVSLPGAPGNSGQAETDRPHVDYLFVGPGYGEAIGLRVIEGRLFGEGDAAGAPPVVIIDDVLAARFYPGSSALGRPLALGFDTLTIVGVMDQPRLYSVHADDRPQVLLPLLQRPETTLLSYAVATAGEPGDLASRLRGILDAVDASLPVTEVRTLEGIIRASLGNERLSLMLLLAFAVSALVLATLGLYGVVSHAVERRTHEMGVRIALGADRAQVLRIVLWQGLRLTSLGVLLGLVGSLAAARVVGRVVTAAAPDDLIVYTGVTLILVAITAAAAYVPAWRATRIDPSEALRTE